MEGGDCGGWRLWRVEIVEGGYCGGGDCGGWRLWRVEIEEGGDCVGTTKRCDCILI